jgi:uncharacterized protein (DUF4415 family)
MNVKPDPLTPAELAEIEKRRAAARERARNLPPMTDEEDAAITAAALSDPDAQPMTEEELDRMRPAHEVLPDLVARHIRRGRPKLERPKEQQTLRLDADVLDHFRATGPGWQGRINATLRKAIGKS